jgi:hypothetical protein
VDDRHLEAKEIHTRINYFWMRVRRSSHQNATSNHGGQDSLLTNKERDTVTKLLLKMTLSYALDGPMTHLNMGHTLTDLRYFFASLSLYIYI